MNDPEADNFVIIDNNSIDVSVIVECDCGYWASYTGTLTMLQEADE
jgi:hypothetical protein